MLTACRAVKVAFLHFCKFATLIALQAVSMM